MLTEEEQIRLDWLTEMDDEGALDEAQFNELNSLLKKQKIAGLRAEADSLSASIPAVRKAAIREDNPVLSSLFPYTANKMAETGEDAGFTEGLKDIGSLAGRAAYQSFNPSSGVGMTSEELAAQGNWGGAVMTDPLVGWSIPLAPIGAAAGGATALGLGVPRVIPLAEIAGSTVASTAPAPFLRDSYGVKDLGIDAIGGLLGGALGTGLASVPKKVAFARMRNVLAKEGINDVTDETLEQVYTRLGTFGGGTSKKAGLAAEKTTSKIASNLEPQYSGPNAAARETARELILQPEAFDQVAVSLEKRAMLSPKDPLYLKESAVRGYKGRLASAKKSYESIIDRAHRGKEGQYFDPEAWQAAVGDVLSDVKDIPGAVDKLAGGLAKGSQLRPDFELEAMMYAPDVTSDFVPKTVARRGDDLRYLAAQENVKNAKMAEAALRMDANALNAQGQLSRLYTPEAIQLNVLGLGKAMIADVPSAARSTDAALRSLTMGAAESKKEYDFPYRSRLRDLYLQEYQK